MFNEYADSLKGINADSTIVNKVHAIIMFFEVNGLEIENDLAFEFVKFHKAIQSPNIFGKSYFFMNSI